jgi:magnesium-transporting ATPase (P-type)
LNLLDRLRLRQKEVRSFLKEVPIFGSLYLCRFKDYRAALRELLSSIVISLLPIIAISIVYNFFTSSVSATDRLWQFATNGELLLAGCAIAGPLCYAAYKTHKHGRDGENLEIPHRLAFFVFYILIVAVFTLSFLILDLNRFADLEMVPKSSLGWFSIATFVVCVTLYFVSLTYRHAIESRPSENMTSDTEAFVAKWKNSND